MNEITREIDARIYFLLQSYKTCNNSGIVCKKQSFSKQKSTIKTTLINKTNENSNTTQNKAVNKLQGIFTHNEMFHRTYIFIYISF